MKNESGSINISLIVAIVFALTTIGAAVGFGWAYTQMSYYQNETDLIVDQAVADAKNEQQQIDQANFVEESKKPFVKFNDKSIYGQVKFDYPKTWSVYNEKSGSDIYKAYFNPSVVPAIGADVVYALRLSVENKPYADILKSYDGAVSKGDLSASPLTLGRTESFDGYKGMRLDGQITKTISGSAAIFPIRDKTLILQTDSQNFMNDFNDTILATLSFQP